MQLFNRLNTLFRNWQTRRLVKSHVAALKVWQQEVDAEAERLRGKWHCYVCDWEGGDADPENVTWELEHVRGVVPRRLEKVADCPKCGKHAARLGCDPGRPIPEDYPVSSADSRGLCPSCGSTDTIPIIRGYPSNEGMLAASRGRAKLGGCVIIHQEDGSGPTYSSCKGCGYEW